MLPPERNALRRRFRAARRALGEELRTQLSLRILHHILPLLEPRATVAMYASYSDEVDTGPLVAALADHRLLWPRVEGDEVVLAEARRLAPGFRGVPEPPADAPAVDLAVVDAILVPGLAFTRRGDRLGQGGGHYDRLLASPNCAALTVGLAFEVQVADALPMAAHDRPVHVLVTENGVWYRPQGPV